MTPTPHVLIVEDDTSLRELLAIIVEGEGLAVETASNGEEALERMAEHLPAIILLDMRMPVMDGWQLCREIDVRGGPRPPIVVLTAATDPALRAREVHADAWLSKPFERDDLITVIHRILH